jgi:hypothetical protein
MQSIQTFSIGQFLKSRNGLIFLVFFAIAAFFLIIDHIAHVTGLLPYALLFLCPLLHLLMHRGHGGHEGEPRPPRLGGER